MGGGWETVWLEEVMSVQKCPDPDTNVDSVMVTGDTRVNFLCPVSVALMFDMTHLGQTSCSILFYFNSTFKLKMIY